VQHASEREAAEATSNDGDRNMRGHEVLLGSMAACTSPSLLAAPAAAVFFLNS